MGDPVKRGPLGRTDEKSAIDKYLPVIKVLSGVGFSSSDNKLTIGSSDEFVLSSQVVAGTPDPSNLTASNTANIKLKSPILQIDTKKKTLQGYGVLSIDDPQYPVGTAPTEIKLWVQSSPPSMRAGKLSLPVMGRADLGPLKINFKLKVGYDLKELTKDGINKSILQKMKQPEFDLTGTVELAIINKIPLINQVLKTRYAVWGKSFSDYKYYAWGMIAVPPGAILSLTSPGWGVTHGARSRQRSFRVTAASLAVPSPTALFSELSLYLYANAQFVRRLSDGWEISVDLSASKNKTYGGKSADSNRPIDFYRKVSGQKDESDKTVPALFGELKLIKRF